MLVLGEGELRVKTHVQEGEGPNECTEWKKQRKKEETLYERDNERPPAVPPALKETPWPPGGGKSSKPKP
jgi:hypothetical protein